VTRAHEATPPEPRPSAGRASGVTVLDWVEFTVHGELDAATVAAELFPFAESWRAEAGRHGYLRAMVAGPFRVEYAGSTPGMGVHVVITGAGCRLIEDTEHWAPLLAWVRRGMQRRVQRRPQMDEVPAVSFSRLDTAWDFYDGTITPGRVEKALRRGEYVSRWRSFKPDWTMVRGEGKAWERDGYTVYVGSPTSEARLVVYDKLAERANAGADVEGVEHWTRVEARWRNDRADAVFAGLMDGATGWLVERLVGYIDFRRDDGSGPRHGWWQRFVRLAQAAPLGVSEEPATVERRAAWYDRQIARSRNVLVDALGEWPVAVMEARAASDRTERQRAQDAALVAAYRQAQRSRALRSVGRSLGWAVSLVAAAAMVEAGYSFSDVREARAGRLRPLVGGPTT
jgi:hypothetical protein